MSVQVIDIRDGIMSKEEADKATSFINDYINSCNCEDLLAVHWELRVIYTVTCELLKAIEDGRTQEHQQH